jgi:hypothetical protein
MAANITFQYRSTAGVLFNVNPALTEYIAALIDEVRSEIAVNRAAAKLIGYLSVPLSSKGGGDFNTNADMAAHVASRVGAMFGDRLWLLNPASYSLPDAAGGGDYMAVWADVLAGDEGSGSDFDMAYFVGPEDVWEFFGVKDNNRLGAVEAWLAAKAKTSSIYDKIYSDDKLRLNFLRYYGLRGSTIFSKGCHDEWNIVVDLNMKREIGNDIAVYFDGMPVEPGDYGSRLAPGNEIPLLH